MLVGLAGIGYGILEGAEAYGLLRRRRWGEYLTVVATSLLLVPESWELASRPSPLKALAVALNAAIVLYLTRRLRGARWRKRVLEHPDRAIRAASVTAMTATTSKVPARLSATLVELVDLQLLAKQLHWAVAGALFRPLHEQFDELAEIARTHADAVAERCVTLGVIPDGQSPYVASASPLDRVEAAPIEDLVAVEVGVRMLDLVARHIHGRIVEVADLDPVSQDVLVEAGRDLEQQLFLLRAHRGPSAVPIGR